MMSETTPSPIPTEPEALAEPSTETLAEPSTETLAEPSTETLAEPSTETDRNQQVLLKSEDGKLYIILPREADTTGPQNPGATNWNDLWQQIKQRLNAGERFWQPNTEVYLKANNRLLDSRQLQAIADALSDIKLQLVRVYTSRRQTAITAAGSGYSVEQLSSAPPLNQTKTRAFADPLYLETTIRSGTEIRHPGTVIVMGDVNPGGSIIADGDILIWGKLRGVVHAGAGGKTDCIIMALEMEPTQIRIADIVARAPEPPSQYYPEVAHISAGGIRITPAAGFYRESSSEKSK
ncbi:septum site-determining protein MinC [Ancylothrix sp. C2]|uniref:septum site-determining protein MinC n=1 Tax=Ancylothrix sp. D3o TaxID=2953691 RepID=UPI0021BB0DDF|nr:septum site-determining protein MinC [Ancylothrix sp. D3o]MCT7951401.1 septum site-determining protein MinC [Ancylothrix sp. D3o]